MKLSRKIFSKNVLIIKLFIISSFFILTPMVQAHVLKNSSSELSINNNEAKWVIAVHEGDYNLMFKEVPEKVVKDYLSRNLKLKRGNDFCQLHSMHLNKGMDKVQLALDFDCKEYVGDLRVFYDLFYGDWSHRHIAKINWNGETTSQIFSPSQIEKVISAPSAWNTLITFFKLGLEHILVGYDHILFLLTLLLGARRFSHLLWLVTAFTLAHSLSLAFATLEWVSLSPEIVEPIIAASIVILAVLDFRTPLTRETRGMVALTFIFGLIHGLGFSTILKDSGIHGKNILLPLFSFNGGVEAGQILIVGALYPLLLFLQKKFPHRYPSIRKIFLSMIGVVGTYWLVTRFSNAVF